MEVCWGQRAHSTAAQIHIFSPGAGVSMETFAVNKCMASRVCVGTTASALQALRLYFLAGE